SLLGTCAAQPSFVEAVLATCTRGGSLSPMPDFDGRCPWCGRSWAGRPSWLGAGCACGAIVRCAPPPDFDEVIDPAIDHFGLTPDAATVSFGDLRGWLQSFGVEIRFGGEGDDTPLGRLQFYWFKRVRDIAPGPEERLKQLESSADAALSRLHEAEAADASALIYPVARDALSQAARIAQGLGRTAEAARLARRLLAEIPAAY